MAADSLALLRAALYDARFPALFELELYGAIVGIFELNNLGELAGESLVPQILWQELFASHCPKLFYVSDLRWSA